MYLILLEFYYRIRYQEMPKFVSHLIFFAVKLYGKEMGVECDGLLNGEKEIDTLLLTML